MLPTPARFDTALDARPHPWLAWALVAAAASLACAVSAMALAQPAPTARAEPTSGSASSASDADMTQRPATPSRLATRSLMLHIASCGSRLVAVGERGRVLLSDDAGRTWRQAKSVPASVTLTAVQCADAARGWAVGHAGVVLRTDDAGETWVKQLDGTAAARLALKAAEAQPDDAAARQVAEQWVADGADKPFLALHFSSPTHGLVVGAYGLIYSTDDGGASWQSRWMDTENPKGMHLNAVRAIGSQTYIAGERGLLLRTDDGKRFVALKSPYEGSWFAIDAAPGGGVALAGLRGNVYVMDAAGADNHPNAKADAASPWRKLALPTQATVNATRALRSGKLLLIAQDGSAYALGADGKTAMVSLPPGAPPTACIQANDDAWVLTTFRGPLRVMAPQD